MSFGTLLTAPTMLNRRYHCMPVRRRIIEARFRVTPRYGVFLNGSTSIITTSGNRAVAGIDCPISKIGTSILESLWLLAMRIPAATVQPSAMREAVTRVEIEKRDNAYRGKGAERER